MPFSKAFCHDVLKFTKLTEAEINDVSLKGLHVIVARVAEAFENERNRGRSGHWSFNPSLQMSLKIHLKAATAALDAERAKRMAA